MSDDVYGYEMNPEHRFSNNKSFKKGTSNIVWKYEFSWYQSTYSKFMFKMGNDFGRGYAMWLNNWVILSEVKTNDHWLGYNWNNNNGVINYG